MSTRGLLGCRIDGTLHGTYNHMDSYPDGLGSEVVEVCRDLANDQEKRNTFIANFRKLEWVDDQDVPTAEQIEKIKASGFNDERMFKELDELQDAGINQKTEHNWYWAIRDFQGISGWFAITDGFPYMIESSSFIKDSLFCEYAYVLDLNRLVLEFWEGFNKVYIEGKDIKKGDMEQDTDGSYFYKDENGVYKYGECKKVGESSIFSLHDDSWKEFFTRE